MAFGVERFTQTLGNCVWQVAGEGDSLAAVGLRLTASFVWFSGKLDWRIIGQFRRLMQVPCE